jgi:DNA polymerase-3 subunit gamma/tau
MAEHYIVSARKYRPQTFDTVIGQEHITTTLKNAIRNNHLAHAFLFCGPRGVGKTTCARILAKTINCEKPSPDMEACGECSTCQSFKDNTSFNVFELDAASNNSVEDIRNLTDQVRFAPQQGRYKIYIIDEVHMLSSSAFNAFLKTLEEPPPYAIFILATTEKHKILPTILSRCQIFDFKRITTNDIVAHLQGICAKESIIAQESALHIIAQKSEGCMRDALSMLDRIVSFTNGMLTYANTMEHLNMLDADFYFGLTDQILSQDVSGALLMLDNALERGFEGDVILEGLAEHIRNLLLCKDARMAKLLDVPNEHKPIYHEKANQVPPSFILSALNVINDSELNYKSTNNKRLHIEMCFIRLCYVLQATALGDDVKKNTDPVIPVSKNAEPVKSTPSNAGSYNQEPAMPAVAKEPEPVKPKEDKPLPAAYTPQPTEIKGGNRRISKSMIADLGNTQETGNGAVVAKELTPELIIPLFEQYKQDMQLAGNKTMVFAQLSSMTIELIQPDEIRIIASTEIGETFAKEQRNALLEYFRRLTGMMLRVTTELRIDKTAQKEEQTIMSKPEIFEAMVKKNPELGKLKDNLGLQIEY